MGFDGISFFFYLFALVSGIFADVSCEWAEHLLSAQLVGVHGFSSLKLILKLLDL